MKKKIFFLLVVFVISYVDCVSQVKNSGMLSSQGVSIEYSLYVTGNPLVFSRGAAIYLRQSLASIERHNLELSHRIATLSIADVDRKYFIGSSLNYRYVSLHGFEASVMVGAHYMLTRLQFDRYEYEGATFKNKGRYLHDIAPTVNMSIGQRAFKNKRYSFVPYLNFGLTKLSSGYKGDFFSGFQPSLSLGLTIYKSKPL